MYEGYQVSLKQAKLIVTHFMESPGNFHYSWSYGESLDALVPVWEKLRPGPSEAYLTMEASGVMVSALSLSYMHGYNIYQACLIATAVHIQRREHAQNKKENDTGESGPQEETQANPE